MKSDLSKKKIILLKITGELISKTTNSFNVNNVRNLADQIKHLLPDYLLGLVIGGGNIFRGGPGLKISEPVSHQIGMISTMINSLILQDVFNSFDIKTTILCAFDCQQVGISISPQNIIRAIEENNCLIFCGGTGNPYFTTDTSAVIRALQINASELWKGTKVDGVYTKDPKLHSDAKLIKNLTYSFVLNNQLGIIDRTATELAEKHRLRIRIFNIFEKDALIKLVQNEDYGSIIQDL